MLINTQAPADSHDTFTWSAIEVLVLGTEYFLPSEQCKCSKAAFLGYQPERADSMSIQQCLEK